MIEDAIEAIDADRENFLSQFLDWEELTELSGTSKRKRPGWQQTMEQRKKQGSVWHSSWGELLNSPSLRTPGSREYKRFRRRFRMPPDLFLDHLVPLSKKHNIFEQKHRSRNVIEMKLLVGLRMLGRDDCGDAIAELSGIGESSAFVIFHQFCRGITKYLYPLFVQIPEPGSDLYEEVTSAYTALGFPGCVGSLDCTHIKWSRCPSELRNLCKGKEGFPTLSFEVVCDHSRRIHHCTEGFYGTTNDQVVVVNDKYIRRAFAGKFKDCEFKLRDKLGREHIWKGAYFLCDGGYPDITVFLHPGLITWTDGDVLWCEWIESVRKDVECTFGILKARFRFLRNGVEYWDDTLISNAMKTACVLHNMILEFDGLGDFNWEEVDPDEDLSDDDIGDGELDIEATPAVDNTAPGIIFNHATSNADAILPFDIYANASSKGFR